MRRPLPPGTKKTWEETSASASAAAAAAASGGSSLSFAAGSAESEELTEDDKLASMMSNATEMYAEKHWEKKRGRDYYGARPPIIYTCSKCNRKGHWAQDCPLTKAGYNGAELKKTTGIPRSFLVPADKTTPGAKINPQGKNRIHF